MDNQPIRIRAVLRDGVVHAQVLMPHPMETGLRHDSATGLVPAHHIDEVRVTLDDRTVFSAHMSIAVSRDPLLGFRFRCASAGPTAAVRCAATKRSSPETLPTNPTCPLAAPPSFAPSEPGSLQSRTRPKEPCPCTPASAESSCCT
jgi:sulfur-oxidizing protein SoxZ